MSYTGRYTTGIQSRNFGGINRDASIVNISDNQAYSITNWDIGQRGTIKRRFGWQGLSTVGRLSNPIAVAFFAYPDTDGVYHYAAIAYNLSGSLVLYEASDPAGPWTAAGGGLTWTETDPAKYVGIKWKGKLFIVNGTDAPAVAEYGEDAKTLKIASQLATPSRLGILNTGVTGASGSFKGYGISAITPVGETQILITPTPGAGGGTWYVNTVGAAPGGVDGITSYYTLSWDSVPGAQYYGIYFYGAGRGITASNAWSRIDLVPYGVTTWRDTASNAMLDEAGNPYYAQVNNTAFNTPAAWETDGYPTGGCVLARGRDERLLLWRGDTVYGSAVSDPLDWWASGNAMVFAVSGGGDVEIVNGANLFDYLMLFSKKQCWVFTGSGPSDISINKIIPVGCAGPHALVHSGTDTYLMSQFGPTSFKRIMAGADVSAAHGWADRIKPIMFDETNTDQWSRCWAYTDLKNSRVVWTLPATGQTVNGKGIVYQYDTDSFTTYDSWGFTHVEEVNYTHYALNDNPLSNGVCQIGTGTTDNGSAIVAEYKTGWFNFGTWEMGKRMVWVDVIGNRSLGNYTFDVSWNWDYGQSVSSSVTCTQTTTDGSTIDTTSSLSSEHRVYTDGFGNAVQLIFTASTADQDVEILAWRPDIRGKGLRKV